MEKLMVVILVLMLSGCFYQTINPGDIKISTSVCSTHDGINNIKSWWLGSVIVTCNDNYSSRI